MWKTTNNNVWNRDRTLSDAKSNVLAGAMRLLASREHSQHELRRKLQHKGHDTELVDEVIQELAEQNLQSEERFVESFISSHRARGKGPQRILLELKQHSVPLNLINEYLNNQGIDWFESASLVRSKKYGNDLPLDYNEQMKQAKFLEYRGFTHEQIFSVLKAYE